MLDDRRGGRGAEVDDRGAGAEHPDHKTLGCVFTLQDTPPNPDEIFDFFDNTDSIPRDASLVDGWQYDPATNQVTFYGPSCDLLKQGQVTDVDIVFGCNEPTPE